MTGKSTLAKALVDHLGAGYLHLTYRFTDDIFNYHTAALEWCLKQLKHRPVVLDRWWATELVYAAAFRGGSDYLMGNRMLERVASKFGAVYVLCQPSDRAAYLDHHQRKKELRYKTKKHALNGRTKERDDQGLVYDLYNDWVVWSNRPEIVTYDFMTHGHRLDDVCQYLIGVAYDHVTWTMDIQNWRNQADRRFAGEPNAPVLFVLDKASDETRREMWPGYGRHEEFDNFARVLTQGNIRENEFLMCSIRDKHDNIQIQPYEIADIEYAKGKLDKVAVGMRAADALDVLGYQDFKIITDPTDPVKCLADLKPIFNKEREEEYEIAKRNLCVA